MNYSTEIFYFVLFIVLLNLLFSGKRKSILGCGLVGFSGTEKANLALIRVLLWHNSLTRGKHATGVFTPASGVLKDAVEASTFINSGTWTKVKTDKVLIGHVRAATSGNTTDPKGAHPWDLGDIVMQHNGTLSKEKELAKLYDIKDEEWTVDSQVLGLALQKNFKDNTPFKALEEYEGAAAVMIYHKELDTLFVAHDKERPLEYGYLNGQMYISSLKEMLTIIGCSNIQSFQENVIYAIKEGKILSETRYVPRNSKFYRAPKKLAVALDILTYEQHNKTQYKLQENHFTGFMPNVVKAQFLEKYWVRSKITTNSNPESTTAKLTKGKFYKITSVENDGAFRVSDDDNKVRMAFVGQFEIDYFIPTAGSMVLVTGSNEVNFTKDHCYEVVYHAYNDYNVYVKNNKGTVVQLSLSSCRIAVESDFYGTDNESVTTSQVKVIHLPASMKTTDKDVIADAEIIDDDDELPTELDLLRTGVDNLVMILDSATDVLLGGIQNNLLTKEEIEREVEKLTYFINCMYDESFIQNLNENSYKNFEISDALINE